MREGAGGRAEADTAAAAATVARRSYGKLIAILAARSRDVAGADDALADAFAAALAGWPLNGVPRNPEAWLLTAARRKLIDAARRQRSGEAAGESLPCWVTCWPTPARRPRCPTAGWACCSPARTRRSTKPPAPR